MSYVADVNVKDARNQKVGIPAAQEDDSLQERALERHHVICRRIEVSVQQRFRIMCSLKCTTALY